MKKADHSEPGFGPSEIRALRGDRSRATFAQLLGVTPLTVYRWELPEGAPQARRPRGPVLEQLRQLNQSVPCQPPLAEPVAPITTAPHTSAASRAEQEVLLPALERIGRGDWRRSETELLSLFISRQLTTADSRALVAAGLAQIQVLLRSDGQRALSTLLPVLNEMHPGRLDGEVEAYVHAVAALVFTTTDGRIFDASRANLHAERAEGLTGPHATEVRFLARLAAVHAAFSVQDQALLASAFARVEEVLDASLPPLLQCLADEVQALEAWVTGRASVASRGFAQVASKAEQQGYACIQARALAFVATRQLDDLHEPSTALSVARKAQAVAREASLGMGLHSMFASACEAEALLRLARMEEAEKVMAEAERTLADADVPPLVLVQTMVRLAVLSGKHDRLGELATRLEQRARQNTGLVRMPIGADSIPAYATYVRALAQLYTQQDHEVILHAFKEADRRCVGNPLLQRDVVVAMCPALLVTGKTDEAQLAARHAQRFLDRFPSPWRSALLRQWEGSLLVWQGRWAEARQMLEAALGTFQLAGDLPEAALTKRSMVLLGQLAGDPETSRLLAESDAELARLGVAASAWPHFDAVSIPPPGGSTPATGTARVPSVLSLVSPLKRLSVRGVAPSLILQELMAVLGSLFAGHGMRLEEVDSTGTVQDLGSSAPQGDGRMEWFEFGDGAGRRLRVGMEGPLHDGDRAAVTMLVNVTGLALEIACLRGFAHPQDPMISSDSEGDLPGFIAVAPAMRRLRAELVRMSNTRATAIITGESGVGKEVVAHAVHVLSTRAKRPYVAFNCASVPRDLFEGQLFGYRKGAFSGANADHPGVIRSADGGTVFLDEVGELPLDVQPKLLRFLENGEVFPLGGLRPITVDVRVIAATHRELATLVREGRFREDLFYRLQVVTLRVPPLRERREDIIPLARHFLRRYVTNGEPPVLSPDALARLMAYPWPGNVRELRNVVERTVAFTPLPPVLTGEMLRF